MDFKSFKDKAIKKAKQFKDKAIEISYKTVNFTAKKLSESGFTISTKEELEKFIKKSAKTNFKDKETWIEKIYSHRVIVIFWDEKSDFFKKSLVNFPILVAKAFSQNIPLKLAKHNIKDIVYQNYNLDEFPSLVIFENEKFLKIIKKEENILKLVKFLSLDINKAIDEFD